MNRQLINVKTGGFTLDKGFTISNKTKADELIRHFGKEGLSVRDFKNGHSNYSVRNLKLDDLYFILMVYFLNEQITKLEFILQAGPYDDAGWDSFDRDKEIQKGKFMEQWMATQKKGDHKTYDWGKMGVSYDFHNLSSSCFISYNPVSVPE